MYLTPPLSPDHHIQTGPLKHPTPPWGEHAARITSERVLDHNCSVLFWKPVAGYFQMQSKIDTFPTCSVHSFTLPG